MLLTGRDYYKPFDYEWAFKYYHTHEKMHWLPEEVPLDNDVDDWSNKLEEGERELLTQLFRFFTQADVDVAQGYIHKFLPTFGKTPEIAMMMSSFAAREAVHVHAYSLLLDTIGMPESEYQAFREYKEMKDKHEYLEDFNMDTPQNIAKSLAVYSGFTEGMQLFSSFAILMNFSRFNKMKGMCTIIDWSIRDESLHVEAMLRLFREFCKEKNDEINRNELENDVKNIARKMVELEDQFIELAFGLHQVKGLDKDEVKEYIRYITDRRLDQLGMSPVYYVTKNPLPWLEELINSVEHTNFFEGQPTDYSKANLDGNWSDMQW